MKKTQITDTRRNISKQFVPFLSIIVISALAVTAFLGINYAVRALESKASDYYRRLNMRDAEVNSTMLLTSDDIEAIKNTDGVSDVEGVLQTEATLAYGEESMTVYAHSINERISLAELTAGRLPKTAGECAVEQELMELMDLEIGSRVTLGNNDGSLAPYLLKNSFVITGSFIHADHYSKIEFADGNRYVMLSDKAFDTEKLDGCFMEAVVTFDKPGDTDIFGKDYKLLSAEEVSLLNALGEERAPAREAEVRKKYREEIDDGQKELDDARKELDDARKELDDSAKEIADKEKELEDAKTTLANAKKQIEKAERDLEKAEKELTESRAKLDAAKSELDSTASQLEELHNAAIAASALGDMSYMAQYEAALAQYNAKRSEYLAGEQQYNKGNNDYYNAYHGIKTLKKRYREGLEEYDNGVKELEDAKKELEDGEEEYARSLADYEDADAALQELKDTFGDLSSCHWAVFSIESNGGYLQAESGLNIHKLAMTFAMLFVVIGALVIYATVARIVDDQRTLVGTGKALGLFNREITAKYLIFGVSATFIGIIAGIAFAYFFLQRMILDSYEKFYVAGSINNSFDITLSAAAALIGMILSTLAVFFACSSLVKLPAVRLMQDSYPSLVKNPGKARNNSGSLYSRLIVRNMRADVGRVNVTVISVAGCCILLVIGFTISYALNRAVDVQYLDIFGFDQKIIFSSEVSETAERDIGSLLEENGQEYIKLHSSPRVFCAGKELSAGELFCGEDIESVLHMYAPVTGKPVPLGDDGIYIQRRTSKFYDVGIGDTIVLYDDDLNPYDVTVAGIYENYFSPGFVMSAEGYKNTFGKDAPINCFLLTGCPDTGAFQQRLSNVPGFTSITGIGDLRERALESTSSLSMLTILLIVVAGLMAFFILLNLANMYINKKKKELTIMRVNGFTTAQTIAYIAREAVITTVLGIISGVAAGGLLAYLIIIVVLDTKTAGPVLSPDFAGWGYAAGLTALYSFVIYYIALRKVRYLKLTDING